MGKKSDLLLQLFIIGLTACTLSLAVIRFYPSWYFTRQQEVANIKNKAALISTIKSSDSLARDTPLEIIIPSINIALPVAPGVITGNVWTLYDDKVTWLTTSRTPGDGNIIIYGHNLPHLFRKLPRIAVGEAIAVKTAAQSHLYIVQSKRRISPDDIDAVLSSENRLTLYTCDGYLDQWRELVTAQYAGTL